MYDFVARHANIQNQDFAALPESVLDRPAVDLHVSVRVLNGFARNGIKTVRDIMRLTRTDLFRLKNIGEKSIKELEEELCRVWKLGVDYFGESPTYEKTDMDRKRINRVGTFHP